MTSARDDLLVTQRDWPEAAPNFPSKVSANLALNNGVPRVIQWLKIKFRSVHKSANTPETDLNARLTEPI